MLADSLSTARGGAHDSRPSTQQKLSPLDFLHPYLRYLLCALWLLGNSAVINLLVQIPSLVVLFPLSRSLYANVIAITKRGWTTHLMWLVRWFGPTTLKVDIKAARRGDEAGLVSGKPMVVLANHVSWADWLYLWCFLAISGQSENIFFVLDHRPRSIPILGWGMRFFRFFFIGKTIWEKEKVENDRQLQRMEDTGWKLVFFPEGSVMNERYIKASETFQRAKATRDVHHHFTLAPRTKGINHLLTTRPKVPILDVTLGYPHSPRILLPGCSEKPYVVPSLRYNLRSIFCLGDYPRSLHIQVQSRVNPLLNQTREQGDEELRTVLGKFHKSLWEQKEQELERIYSEDESGNFKGSPCDHPVLLDDVGGSGRTLTLPLALERYWPLIPGAPARDSEWGINIRKAFEWKDLVICYVLAGMYGIAIQSLFWGATRPVAGIRAGMMDLFGSSD